MDQTSTGINLYPHQRDALNRLKNGSILWGGTGTGKSITAVAYYLEKEAPRDVYIITTAKKRDDLEWDEEFIRGGVSRHSAGPRTGSLTVDSWNNIAKYQKVTGAFFIFDEQRLVGSGKWVKAFLRVSRRNHWILLSATPGDTWLDYIPVFVANGFYTNATEFKREHVVYRTYSKFPKVDRYTGLGRLLRQRNGLLVEMPYLSHTVRHNEAVMVDHDTELFGKVVKRKWNPFENRPLRDVTELFICMRRIANSHPSRLNAVRDLLNVHAKLIVFYNFDYELEMLRTLSSETFSDGENELWQTQKPANTTSLPSGLSTRKDDLSLGLTAAAARPSIHQRPLDECTNTTSTGTSGSTLQIAEWNGHKHQAVPKGDRWVYLVQYAAGAEGWNCITTDAMCFYSLPYSYKLYHQAHGRIDRLNTPFKDLWYYSLKGTSLIDKAVGAALDEKRSFNESAYHRTL